MKIKSAIKFAPQLISESALNTQDVFDRTLGVVQEEFYRFTFIEGEFVMYNEETFEFTKVAYDE